MIHLTTLAALAGQAGGGAAAPRPSMLSAFLPFILVFVIFYVLLILPQRKRQKKHETMVGNLKPGDRVITTGGIFGTVMGVQKDRIELKIAASVKIDVTKGSIGAILGQGETTPEEK